MKENGGREPIGLHDGKRIQALRDQAGYSRPQFAELLGITLPALINIENGNRPASLAMLLKIARALDQTIDSLLKDAA